MKLAHIVLILSLTGCATTPSGKIADGAVHADHVTTIVALTTVSNAVELNPLAPLGPLRYLVHKHIESMPCEDQWLLAFSSGVAGGFAGNNLLVLAGVSWHPAGLLVGIPLYLAAKERLPECDI